jgi:hypothetical protein
MSTEIKVKFMDNLPVPVETAYGRGPQGDQPLLTVGHLIFACTLDSTRQLLGLPAKYGKLTLHVLFGEQLSDALLSDHPLKEVPSDNPLILQSTNNAFIEDIETALRLTFEDIEVASIRSSGATTKSVCERYSAISELRLQEWPSFTEEVLQTTSQIRNVPLPKAFIPYSDQRQCEDEAAVMLVSQVSVFASLEKVMFALSTQEDYPLISPGKFLSPAGRTKVIGDPDRAWVPAGYTMSRLIVEMKSPWAVDNLDGLIKAYADEYKEYNATLKKLPKQKAVKGKIIRVIEQAYVYMTLNKHRFGAITTFNETVFFKKEEDTENPGSSKLLVSPAIKCGQRNPYTLMAAWTFILLTVEGSADWLYSSPNSSAVPSPTLSTKLQHTSKEQIYISKDLNGLFKWENIIARSQAGAVAVGQYKDIKSVAFKTIDVSKRPGGLKQFKQEVEIYRALESLQGMGC